MLLAWKTELSRFAGGLQPAEIRSAVLLGLIGFVIYPVLPKHYIDPWQLFNPSDAWISVIAIAGIGFVNYVFLRIYSTRGLYLGALFGGLVNSSATVAELAARAKETGLVTGLQPLTVLEPVADGSNARLKPGSNDWLAYQSNQSGRAQVYLTRFPHPGVKYQVSKDGGGQPVWSKDGKTLYYLDPYRKLTAVDVQTSGEAVQIGAAKPLFTAGIRHSISTEAYDIARDGRFLVVDSITESTAPVVLVTNWDTELKK